MAGITPLFDDNDLNNFYDRFQEWTEEKFLTLFTYLGENFVRLARENGNYRDHTGNLRSSIGYGVVRDGRILSQDYQMAGQGSEGQKGVTRSRMLVETLAQEFSTGWALIGVAGMDYALFVENLSGKDVISSSAVATEMLMREIIKQVANG
jgi:hypothetical protein